MPDLRDDNDNVNSRWGTRILHSVLGGAWLFAVLVVVPMDDVLTTETGIEAAMDTPSNGGVLLELFNLKLAMGVMACRGYQLGDTPKAFLEGQTASDLASQVTWAFIEKMQEFDWGVGFSYRWQWPARPSEAVISILPRHY